MKTLFLIFAIQFAFLASSYGAEANYYRFWQGFQKSGWTQNEFLSALPNFMQATANFYRDKSLSSYLVAIPPKNKPAFVPDEFALVAFPSQNIYDSIRATPEGQSYADSHWNYFDKNRSRSAEMRNFDQGKGLDFNVAYNVLAKPVDFSQSYIYVYVGIRKPEISSDKFQFLMRMHVNNVAQILREKGLVGYLMLITPDYEVAYMAFTSLAVAEADFSSDEGKAILNEANKMMTPLMFTSTESFKGISESGHFYFVK